MLSGAGFSALRVDMDHWSRRLFNFSTVAVDEVVLLGDLVLPATVFIFNDSRGPCAAIDTHDGRKH